MIIVDKLLLQLFRGRRCEWCGKHGTEAHHLHSRGAGRLDIPHNLAALCRQCHRKFHDGNIPRRALLLLVADREGTTAEAIESLIWRLRRAPQGSDWRSLVGDCDTSGETQPDLCIEEGGSVRGSDAGLDADEAANIWKAF